MYQYNCRDNAKLLYLVYFLIPLWLHHSFEVTKEWQFQICKSMCTCNTKCNVSTGRKNDKTFTIEWFKHFSNTVSWFHHASKERMREGRVLTEELLRVKRIKWNKDIVSDFIVWVKMIFFLFFPLPIVEVECLLKMHDGFIFGCFVKLLVQAVLEHYCSSHIKSAFSLMAWPICV